MNFDRIFKQFLPVVCQQISEELIRLFQRVVKSVYFDNKGSLKLKLRQTIQENDSFPQSESTRPFHLKVPSLSLGQVILLSAPPNHKSTSRGYETNRLLCGQRTPGAVVAAVVSVPGGY